MASRPRRNFPKIVIEQDTDTEGEDSSSGEEEDAVEEADQVDEVKSEEEEEQVVNGHEEDGIDIKKKKRKPITISLKQVCKACIVYFACICFVELVIYLLC